jgi:hypothetical protein
MKISTKLNKSTNMENTEKQLPRNSKLPIHGVTCRYLFIYVDDDYKLIQYVEAKNQEEAEEKMEDGWVRIVELVEDLQVVYNGR